MRRLGIAGAVALAAAMCATVAEAGPSDGDVTFSPDEGVRMLDSATPLTSFASLGMREDGQLLAAGTAMGDAGGLGSPLIARLNPDGTLSSEFGGGDGVAITPPGSGRAVAWDAAFFGERVVAAGEATVYPPDQLPEISLLVERVDASGELDPTFNPRGRPAGRVITRFGALEAGARAVAGLADGKVLVAGFVESGGSRRAMAARFTADGLLDTTFGAPTTPGILPITYHGESVATAMALDSQGRILLAGTLTVPGPPVQDRALVARLTPQGRLDTTFAGDATIPGARVFGPTAAAQVALEGLAVDAQDRPVVVGATDATGPGRQLFAAKLTAAGSPDASFSPDAPAGMLSQAPAGAGESVGMAPALSPAGDVSVAGRTTIGGLERLLLARFKADGSPDSSFSAGGNLVFKAIGDGADLGAGQAALTASGKLLVSGHASVADAANKAFVARYGSAGAGPLAVLQATWPSLSELGTVKSVVRPGQTVDLDASASSDADGTVVAHAWDLDGDGSFETTGARQSAVFDEPQDVGITVRATDDDGLTGLATQTIRVRPNLAPEALPGVPPPGRQTPRPVSFTDPPAADPTFQPASVPDAGTELADPSHRDFAPVLGHRYAFTALPSIDHDGQVVRYRWALDRDGAWTPWSADPEIEHVFRVAGPRTLRLQVMDDEGAIDTWERDVDLPLPTYKFELLTKSGAPHPGLTLKPGGPAQTVVARTIGSAGPHLPAVMGPEVTGIDGISFKRVMTGPGLHSFDFTAKFGMVYAPHKLSFTVRVLEGSADKATDAGPLFVFKDIKRTIPLVVVPNLQLAVNGLEVAQATQKLDPIYRTFQSVGLRSDPMAYEGVKLAEEKATFARLHAVNYAGSTVSGVTAVLHGTRNGTALAGSPLSPIWTPEDGVKFGFPTGTTEQLDDTRGSFWFRLPRSWTKRSTKINLRGVITPPIDEGSTGVKCPTEGCIADNDLTVKGIPFRPTPKFKVRALKFVDRGNFPPFPVDSFMYGLHQYPIDPFRFEVIPGALWIDSTDIQGDEDEDRILKLHHIAREVAEDRDEDPQLHPRGILMGLTRSRGSSRGTLALPAEIPGTMTLADGGGAFAHELGHVLAQRHASACITVDGKPVTAPADHRVHPVASWPPDEMGELQGYAYAGMRNLQWGPGLVIRSTPQQKRYDLMSYCAAEKHETALSPRNWTIMGDVLTVLENPLAADVTDPSEYTPASASHAHAHAGKGPTLYERGRGAAAAQVAGRSVGVLGTVQSDGTLSGLSTFPLEPGHAPVRRGDAAYAAVARTASGTVVGRAPVELTADTGHDGPRRAHLRAIVPAAGAASIEIHRDGAVVGTVNASAAAPTVRILSPRPGSRLPRNGSLTVRVAIADADGRPVTAKLAWAPDGRRFVALHQTDIAPGTATLRVPAKQIAGARAGAVQVRVDDGFRSGEAIVRRLRAPGVPPVITLETARVEVPAGVAVELRALALDDRGKPLSRRAIEWRIGRRRVATGTAATLRGLSPGRRTVVVRARDTRGLLATRRVTVRVRPAAPAFIDLRVPERIARRARTVTVKAAVSFASTLQAGGRRYRVDRRPRRLRIRVKRGRGPVMLTLTLRAGSKRATVRRMVQR